MANECIPLHEVGPLTCTASAAVTGKRFVAVTAGVNVATGTLATVAHAGAGARALGVATRDAANGARVGVELRGVVPVTAGGTITAGAEVESNASGQAVALSTGKALGQAVSAGTNGNDVFVRLY